MMLLGSALLVPAVDAQGGDKRPEDQEEAEGQGETITPEKASGFLDGLRDGTQKYLQDAKGRTESLISAHLLVAVVEDFNKQHGRMPDVGTKEFLTSSPAGIRFLAILSGMEVVKQQNKKGINHFKVIGGGADDPAFRIDHDKDGLPTGMTDAWGNPYRVILRKSGDKPITFKWGGADNVVVHGKLLVVGSPGMDRIDGTKDDVKSWK
ncbi:MAG: hypothetical protein WBG04_00580 [Haloferula sp.]